MSTLPAAYDPAAWLNTKSRELQFFATDAEVADWLRHLPNELGPYTMTKAERLTSQARVFDLLEEEIRPRLRFAAIQVFADGHEEEDRTQRITEAAAADAREGRFDRKLGRRL
jgi:hypothetical protein